MSLVQCTSLTQCVVSPFQEKDGDWFVFFYPIFRTPEGIDYTHPAFLNADGTSRIYSIWDQSIPSEPKTGQTGRRPERFLFGTEYTKEDINLALQSENPWEVVPSRDEVGHGTFLTGVACGNQNIENEFTGVAPLAQIAVVKCKQAKENLKEYYRINTEEPCFMENDIMLGIRYLIYLAYETQMPLVLCLGMGTNMGSHNRGGALGEMLENYGDSRGIIIVAAGGNEANTSHHYRSDVIEGKGDTEVELRVGDRKSGFTAELWCDAPGLCSVGLISPGGEYSGKTYARLGEKTQINFLLENTTVDIEYLLVSFESGDECVRMRFKNPSEGVWRIRVFNETDIPTLFDIWMPMREFVSDSNYFLRADPDITLCEPSNNSLIITTTFYRGSDRSVEIDSSRGYNRKGVIRPDIAAPGDNIFGPLPRLGNRYPATEEERIASARYGYRTGSSAGAAVTAGACLLLAEWGLVRGNDLNMDSVGVQKYLIRGVNRSGRSFPNREWGYGTLDVYGVFERLLIRE